MTIPVSTVVNVNITRQTQFPSRASFGLGNIVGVSTTISTTERIRFYNNIAGVAVDFPSNTEEWKAANTYFAQSPSPTGIYISRWVNLASKAELRTGANRTTDVTQWALVTNGSFRITINGVAANVTGLTFAAAVTLADVATTIQAGLVAAGFTGATCVYSLSQARFIITSGTTGPTSTISLLTTATASVGTDISGVASGLKYLDGATGSSSVLSQGLAIETIADGLTAIQLKNDNWYGFGYTSSVRDSSSVVDAATWAEAQIKLYFTASNDAATLTTATTSISYQLKTLGFFRVIPFYHATAALYPEFAFMANGFVRDVGSATWKFKQLVGITPSDEINQNELANLKNNHANVYITVGNAAITQEGIVSGGLNFGEYIDTMRGVDWLQNAIQTNVYGLLYSEQKVPYTDTGAAQIEEQVRLALDEAEEAGFIAARVDVNGVLQSSYTITTQRVALVPSSQRSQRIAPDISFTAFLAGAIHFVNVTGIVTV